MTGSSSIEAYQQSAAELFAHFSEGIQQLLLSKELSDEDRESFQRTTDIVERVAKRYHEASHQSSELEQRSHETSLDHLRYTVEMLS